MSLKLKCVVVDSAAFMKNVPVWEHGDQLYSVEGVLAEIKDNQTRQYVASFPVNVTFQDPHPDSYKFIENFTKKSGDYHDLSVVDLKLLALTYQLETKENGNSHLRTEPLKKITNTTITVPVANTCTEDEAVDDSENMDEVQCQKDASTDEDELEDQDDQTWNVISRRGKRNVNLATNVEGDSGSITSSMARKQGSDAWGNDKVPGFYRSSDDPSEVDEDDEEGWLTPENIAQLGGEGELEADSGNEESTEQTKAAAACITADFTMQNVLKNIGLAVLGVDGKLIKDIRTFVLRCFACYAITSDRSKLFCPRCGHRTLKRVSTTINPDGTQQIWISRRPLSTRGMKYNLPKPRGGQHAVQPLLTADQRFPFQWAKKTKSVNALSEDFVAGSSPFSTRDVYSRAAQHGYGNTERGVKGQLKHAKIWKPKRGKHVRK